MHLKACQKSAKKLDCVKMFWLILLGNFLCAFAYVEYANDTISTSVKVYTLIAIGAVFTFPIIAALVYIRFAVISTKRGALTAEKKASVMTGTYGSSTSDWKRASGSLFARLADMKSNPVLRLWWKKQEKMYKLTSENDTIGEEKPIMRTEQQLEGIKEKKSKDGKEKKVKKESAKVMDPSPDMIEEGRASIESPKKEKKIKKDKKNKRIDKVEDDKSGADSASNIAPPNNSSNTNASSSTIVQAPPRLGPRRVSFAPE